MMLASHIVQVVFLRCHRVCVSSYCPIVALDKLAPARMCSNSCNLVSSVDSALLSMLRDFRRLCHICLNYWAMSVGGCS